MPLERNGKNTLVFESFAIRAPSARGFPSATESNYYNTIKGFEANLVTCYVRVGANVFALEPRAVSSRILTVACAGRRRRLRWSQQALTLELRWEGHWREEALAVE